MRGYLIFKRPLQIIILAFDYINKFGFGKKTGIDLNGEASGILFNLE